MDLLCRFPDLVSSVYFGAGPEKQTGGQNLFYQYDIQSAFEIQDPRTETSIVPSVEKGLITKSNSSLSDMKRVSEGFCCCTDTGTNT